MSIKLHSPGLSLALVTDSTKPGLKKVFDHIIPVDKSFGTGLVQKIHLDRYSPFDETIFIDADCTIIEPIEHLFDQFAKRFVSSLSFREDGREDLTVFGDVESLKRKLELKTVFNLHGGLIYFIRSSTTTEVYDTARALLPRYDELGLQRLAGEENDEPLLALAMAKYGQATLTRDGSRIVTPLKHSGVFRIDVLNQTCHLRWGEHFFEPSIIHWTRHFIGHFHYRREARKLRIYATGLFPAFMVNVLVNIAYNASYASFIVLYRLVKAALAKERFKLTPILPLRRFD